VIVIDIVPSHVERARQAGLVARVGDARCLDVADESVDAVLLLGPLYHLPVASDRALALAEAARVMRVDGVLAAAGVSRASVALDLLRKGRFDQDGARDATAKIVELGHDPDDPDPVFHFHTVEELTTEVLQGGFRIVAVHGVEGPAW
jgi:SAM-dependent methyltransferase